MTTRTRARSTLRAAFELLPISYLLLGWNPSESLVGVCRDETTRAGAQLYRWRPFLSGDGVFDPRPEWRTIGVNGEPLSGFRDIPEFTFVCTNNPAARAMLSSST